MRIIRFRIILSFLFYCFTSSILLPIQGSVIRGWFKKNHNVFLAALSAAVIRECLRGRCTVDWLRSCVTKKDIIQAHRAYIQQLDIVPQDCIALPKDLNNLKNYKLFQLKATDQEGPSCAWYATLNAKAIQNIVQNHEPLTAENIKRHVCKQMVPLIQRNNRSFMKVLGVLKIFSGLAIQQTAKLISHLGIQNYYDLHVRDKGNQIIVSSDKACALFKDRRVGKLPYKGFCTKYFFNNLDCLYALLREIKQDQAPIVHILLTVPSAQENTLHAVLLTIVNRPDKKPLLLYLNSNGNSLYSQILDKAGTLENAYITGFIKSLDIA